MIHLDSSVLIDLLREFDRDRPGPAFEVMESIDEGEILAVSLHVMCELRAGAELAKRPQKEHQDLDQLLSGLLVAYPDERFVPMYGRLFAVARKTGRTLPAAMDLLIATAAMVDDAPLVTRNVRDFARIPGLRVIGY